MQAYAPYPKQIRSYDINFLKEKLEKDDYRIIYAGDTFKNVPLTLWFMRRVKSEMVQASVRADYSRRRVGPIEYCLEVSDDILENSFIMPSKTDAKKSVLFVGHSWLSQAVQLTYDYLRNQFGCTAPIAAFVLPLDPSKYQKAGRKNKPDLAIKFMDEHLEHLLVQERFINLLTHYQAAKEAREDSSEVNRTNPQRLLDLEKEKMHIRNFREAAANLGAIVWNKPYMARRLKPAVWRKGAIGMVGAHGQPSTKELKAWKKRRRLNGKDVGKSSTANRALEERLGDREDQFTVEPDISEEASDLISNLYAQDEKEIVDARQEEGLQKYKKSKAYKDLVKKTKRSSMNPYEKAKAIKEAENAYVLQNLNRNRRVSSAKVTEVRNFVRKLREALAREKKWNADDIKKFTQGSARELGDIRQKMLDRNYRPGEIMAYMLARMQAKREGKNLTLKTFENARLGNLDSSSESESDSKSSSDPDNSDSDNPDNSDSDSSDSDNEISRSLSSRPGSILLSPRSRNKVAVGMIGAL